MLKSLTFILVLAGFLFFSSQHASAEVDVSNYFSYTYNSITGPGKDQSSLTDGFRYLNLVNLTGRGELGDFRYYFNLGSQFTDDERKDPQTFLLTNLTLQISNDIHTLILGDTFQAFSQYALSTSLKGGSYRFFSENLNLPEVTFIYGFANPRWDNFNGFGESHIETIEREVLGTKVQYSLTDDLRAGFSIVRTNDSDRINPADELYDIDSYTLDWEYNPIPGLTIDGESSFADTTLSPDSTSSDVEMDGYANRITAIGDGGPSRVTLEYERISPEYKTVVGSATSDREKVKMKWRYKYDRLNTVTSQFLWYRNNLDGIRTRPARNTLD
ncbi:MAG: hypothetical protein R6V56_01760 [Lentisphaeria bacterium]